MLKSEDEVFQKFKDFKVLLENKTGKKIKKLRTDNGLEFCAELFNVIICLGVVLYLVLSVKSVS